MVWFSYHGGHSGEFCAHATSTLEEVVDTAIERGFTHYGLSEHCPRYRAQDLYPGEEKLGIAGLAAAFEAYVARALDLRDARAGEIELFVGFETETLPPEGWLQAMMTLRDAYPFDYIVGSVHDICGRWVDFSPTDTAALTADLGGSEALQIAYFDAVTNMVESLRPDIVAHLDLVRKYEPAGFSFSPRALRAIETTLEAIGTSGGVLDVNCAAFRNGYGPVYPLPQILERARAVGIRVTFGDDSHGAQTVGVGLDQSLAAIAAAGYETVAYLTRADGWREAALDTLQAPPGLIMIEKDMCQSATAQSLTVEAASAADIPFIMSIERSPGYQALVGSYDAIEHRRRMEAQTCTYLLCRNAGELVGFAVIRRDDDGMGTAQLHRIAVSPPGNGYGSAFLRKICRWVFSEHGLDRLWLDVLPSNVHATRLYEKLGFVREGVMRASLRVPGGRQDLVLMSLLREDWERH